MKLNVDPVTYMKISPTNQINLLWSRDEPWEDLMS